MPYPYARLIVGIRHCHVLISGNINSDATGIDITAVNSLLLYSLAKPAKANPRYFFVAY